MATFTSSAGARLTKRDDANSNDTYVVTGNSRGLVLIGNADGDTVKVDGLSTDFTFRASGKTLTITSIDDPSFRIQIQLKGQTASVATTGVSIQFLDGAVTAKYVSAGSSKGTTLTGAAGSQKLTSKAAGLADAVTVDDTKTSGSIFDSDTGTVTGNGVNTALTATVGETLTGTAFDDVFSGATNSTLQDGDQINAGSGSDTLNVLANGGSATAFLNSVETVNVRMLQNTELNTTLWSGISSVKVTNDSIDDRTLTLTGLAAAATLDIADKVNVSARLLDDTGANDTLKVLVNSAGTGSISTLNVEAINLFNSGTNVLDLEGNVALSTVAVSGQGSLTITTNDSVSAINLSQFSGTSTTTVSSTSNLAFTGGTGNDVLVISTQTLTSADTLSGGAGSDTLRASLDGADLRNVSNFETGNFAVSAAVNSGFSGFSTLSFSGTTDVDFNASGIAGGATVNFGNNSAATVTFGYNSGGVANINLTGDTATVALSTTIVSGAATQEVSVVGDAAAYTISRLILEGNGEGVGGDDVRVSNGSSGSLTVTELRARDAEFLALRATGASSVFTVTDLNASGLTSVTLFAEGERARLDLVDSVTVTGIASTLNLVARGTGASLDAGGFSADALASLDVRLIVDQDARFGSANNFDVAIANLGTLTFSGTLGASAQAAVTTLNAAVNGVATVNLNLGAFASASMGVITAGQINSLTVTGGSESSATLSHVVGAPVNGSIGSINLSQAGSGTIIVGSAAATTIGPVTLSGGADAAIRLGDLNGASSIGAVTLNVGASGLLSIGSAASTNGTIGAVSGTAGASAAVTIGALTASGAIGGFNFTLGAGADLTIGSATITGASSQDAFGNISISGGSEVDVAIAAISARQSIGDVAIAIGSSASFSAGTINSVSASIGRISFVVGDTSVASADFTAALGSIGNISLGGSGVLDINVLRASAGIGNILVSGGAQLVGGTFSAGSSIGDVTLESLKSSTLTLDADLYGDLTATGSGGTVTYVSGNVDSVRLSNVGGTVTVDFGDASSVNGITVTGNSSNVSLDLTSVRLFTEITLGTGVSVVTLSTGGDQLRLAAGTGDDTLRFGGSAFNGAGIRNFEFGSALDVLAFSSAGFNLGLGSANPTNNTAGENLNVVNISSAGAGVTFGSAGAGAGVSATDVLVITAAGFRSAGEMLGALASAGSLRVSAVGETSVTAGGEILVVWYNTEDRRTELSIVNGTSVASASDFFNSVTGNVNLLATFSGDIRTFPSAETFFGNFQAY